MLMRRVFKNRVKDVNVLRGTKGCMNDHYLLEAELKDKSGGVRKVKS